MVNDNISDMLTRIRNANMVKHQIVQIPYSKMSLKITEILKEERFIEDFENYVENHKQYLLISKLLGVFQRGFSRKLSYLFKIM